MQEARIPKNIPHSDRHPSRRVTLLLALTLALGALSGCAALKREYDSWGVTAYKRTLPDWISSVFVPMVANDTAESGFEEDFTNALIEELLLDNQLDPVQESKCDAVVRITIKDWQEISEDFAVDDVESYREIKIMASIELFDPKDPETPIGVTDDIPITHQYYSEFRSARSDTRAEAMEELSEIAARRLKRSLLSHMVMTGDEVKKETK